MPVSTRSNAKTACTACGAQAAEVFMDIASVPVHCNLLWPSEESARTAPRGDMRLAFCARCGHVFNAAFDPSLMEYTQAYENSLHFSPRFQAYAEELAQRLIDRYGIRNTQVIDIGCGKGDFLALLCERGNNTGHGFDPSYVPEHMAPERAKRMSIIRDFYSPKFASTKGDLVTCRHVLEHIQFPRQFASTVRESVGSRQSTVVFFEVPNVMYTLKDLGIWDLIYEHCSYFSSASLREVFRASAFSVRDQHELYQGQFLGIDMNPAAGPAADVEPATEKEVAQIAPFVQKFGEDYARKVAYWKDRLNSPGARDERVAVWGGGSKGVTFLNVIRPGGTVGCMVDINPRKQGMFVSGTGHRVVGPEYLRDYRPTAVIVMNAVYAEEIKAQLAGMGIDARVEFA
jgi:SAM-dependent methyltransferase